MSSPVDCAMDVKKRRRMMALNEQKQKAAQQQKNEQKSKEKQVVNLMDCDIGASPKLNLPMRKKGFHSPLSQSKDLDLSKKKK